MPNDGPFIPEASEPNTYVHGRLVPAPLARDVRHGWKAGCAYVVLQALGGAVLLTSRSLGVGEAGVVLGEVALAALCVWGMRRWNLAATVALFCMPIVNTLLLAIYQPISAVPQLGAGGLRVFLLVVFLYFFAKAAIAIWKFRCASNSAT